MIMFKILLLIIIFLLGLVIGSFLNVVIYRLWQKKSFLKGRSFCPHCQHRLAWKDLIPILSFLILRGKCRYCGKKISIQYPLVEITTGLIFLLIFNYFPLSSLLSAEFNEFYFTPSGIQSLVSLFYLLLISCFLIIIFVYDLNHYIILDKVIYPAIITVFLYNLIFNFQFIVHNSIFAAFGAAVFFLTIFLISKGKWMGFGDIKLTFLMGLFLGFPDILVALFLSFFIGSIVGIGLIICKKKSLKSEVPFGPFLITGTFIALFWGETTINWYFNLFSNLIIH